MRLFNGRLRSNVEICAVKNLNKNQKTNNKLVEKSNSIRKPHKYSTIDYFDFSHPYL